MSRRRFEVYLDKVFDFFPLAAAIPEGRHSPRHPWSKVFAALFLGAAAQISSLLQMEAECRPGSMTKRIGPLSNNTFAYAMQHQNPEDIFALGCRVARQIKRNAMLRSYWSRGFVVAAVDGIEICSSYTRCCPRCLERRVKRHLAGQLRECVQYYHRIVVVVVVSGAFPVPLGVRFQQPGECEVACAQLLLQDLVRWLGRRYFDILVADANTWLNQMWIGGRINMNWISIYPNIRELFISPAKFVLGGL